MRICHKQKIRDNNLKSNFHSNKMCLDPVSGVLAATSTLVTVLQAPMVYEYYKKRFQNHNKRTSQLKCLARNQFTKKVCNAPAEYVEVEIQDGVKVKALRCMLHKHHLITYGTNKMLKNHDKRKTVIEG